MALWPEPTGKTPSPSPVTPPPQRIHPNCKSPEEVLKYLWESTSFADVTIVAKGEEIKAHKMILCPRSPFFDAALNGNFAEAHNGTIEVEEDAVIIKTLLQYVYGVPIGICSVDYIDTVITSGSEEVKLDTMKTYVAVHVAADKYGINDIQPLMHQQLKEQLIFLEQPKTVTKLASYTYNSTTDLDDGDAMRVELVGFIKGRMASIVNNSASMEDLLNHKPLLADILRRYAQETDWGSKTLAKKLKHARDEATGSKLSARRNSRFST